MINSFKTYLHMDPIVLSCPVRPGKKKDGFKSDKREDLFSSLPLSTLLIVRSYSSLAVVVQKIQCD